MTPSSISVVGLGKLGSPMVACFASKGYPVVGVDINPEYVAKVGVGKAPVFEPGLDEMLFANRSRIETTQDLEAAVLKTEVTCVIVPTPSDASGVFSIEYVLNACEKIGRALRSKKDYHVVVITSTVMPGATGGPIREKLETLSGKKCGSDFGLCYSPEFIALGSVIKDFLNPDFVLIGESDTRAGDTLEKIYQKTCDNHPVAARMGFANAELTKISINTFVTTKITFANMLARICERLPGADVDVVTSALGLDRRIGSRYLRGAIGYGGPCFPRDNIAFSRLAEGLGTSAALARATDQMNREQAQELATLALREVQPGDRVAILGLSYKPDTDVVEESKAFS